MNLKKLDQSVFEGLPKEYRWAFVCPEGGGWIYQKEPKPFGADFDDWDHTCNGGFKFLGEGYDATDWQNSKIERLSDTCIDDMGIANAQKQSERQDVPTAADIDWKNAPEGATHYSKRFGEYYKAEDGFLLNYLADESRWIVLIDWSISALESSHFEMIKRPESIHDVARSIEAARVAEKSGNRCATCTANICSVIDDCYVQRAQEESARIEEQACMPWPDGDARYFETSDVPETKKYPHYFKDVSDVDAIDLYHVARLYDITDPALFHAFKKIACAGKRGAKDQAQDVQEAIDALKRWQELNV